MRLNLRRVFLGLLLSLLPFAAIGKAAEPTVERFFENLHSLQADFVQTVYDEKDRILETSSGRMYMQRPGRFRWDYRHPYEQVIVADGERLWQYDSELEQVTVRKLDTALSSTPLALLSGAAPIEQVFTVEREATRDGLRWFELRPKDPQADFKLLRIAFDGDALKLIELEDMFNQRTRLEFSHLQPNVAIDPALLHFEPPPGVDVVGDLP